MIATSIIPCLTYQNALKAIDWLCDAFGFEKYQIHLEDDGTVAHAELKMGNAMIMLGSQNYDSPFGQRIKTPKDIEGFESQSPYVVINDIDQHYEIARKHGAQIIKELEEKDYGGKSYMCYDVEGHLWSFGTYNPLKVSKN